MLELPDIGEVIIGDRPLSDELGAKPHYEAGPYVHYCEHPGCIRWGSFGFAVGRAEPNWFCSEHHPEWKPRHEAQSRH